MQRRAFVRILMVVGLLCCSPNSSISPAAGAPADPPKFDSPAAVVSAAEDAFVGRDFKAFADCFDATGQKVLSVECVQLLTVFANLTPDGDGKKSKAVLTKYGLTDLSKQGDESDDHFANRLAGQVKDQRGFIAESMPLMNTDSFLKKFPKGKLANLQIDGPTAKAAYIVVVSPTNTMTQDLTFAQKDSSWKISSDLFFPAPIEVNNQ